MRNSGSYQLVSEHSILSARRTTRDAAITPRTRSQRLKEFGEHVRQIGATRESDCHHDTKVKAPLDFKVFDPGLGKTENTNSRRRRSGEDEFYEKLEEMAEILRSYLANVAVKSSKPEERRETEEPKRETDQIEGSIPWNVIAKLEPEVDERRNDQEPLNEQVAMEDQREEVGTGEPSHDSEELSLSFAEVYGGQDARKKKSRSEWKLEGLDLGGGDEEASWEELMLEDSPATNGGEIGTEASPLIDLNENFLSQETEVCDEQSGDEEEAQPAKATLEALPEKATPEKEDREAIVEMMGTFRDGDVFLSLWNEKHDRIGKERKAGADWISQDLGLLTEPMGQAQSLIFTPPQFTYNRGVLLIKGIMDKEESVGSDGAQYSAEQREFDPGGSPSISCIVWSSCFKLWDPGDLYSASCIIVTSCFQLWDPGGRLLMIVFLISSP